MKDVGICYHSITPVVGNLNVEKESSEGSVISSVLSSVLLSHVVLWCVV